ncbi:hypothetical protein [Rossellomorea oryzaecorticis]|uniref:hypothetical protein n=1 Tax=Rossellomorea oryzaecorticis TaxID=1396505 RepID=UPI003CCB2295
MDKALPLFLPAGAQRRGGSPAARGKRSLARKSTALCNKVYFKEFLQKSEEININNFTRK